MAANATAERVRALVEPIVEEQGCVLWDVRFVKEGASWFLRLFIDKEGGVSIDDCERVSRAVDEPLDEADPIEQSYYLEVSSPGLARELIRPEHFEQMQGEEIVIRLFAPIEGQKEWIGILKGLENGDLVVKCDTVRRFPKSSVSKVYLHDDADL